MKVLFRKLCLLTFRNDKFSLAGMRNLEVDLDMSQTPFQK